MTNHINTLKESLLKRIQKGGIHQRPKWYFVLLAILWSAFIAIILIGITYLISFISLISYESELFDLLDFGTEGLKAFIGGLPWVLVSLVVLLVVTLYLLLRDYTFVYTRPVIYGVLGVVSLISLTSYGISHFDSKYSVARFGEDRDVPILVQMHSRYRRSPQIRIIAHGQIVASSTEGFILQDIRTKEYVTVRTTEATREERQFQVGDYVTVFGTFATSSAQAFGVRQFDPNVSLPSQPFWHEVKRVY